MPSTTTQSEQVLERARVPNRLGAGGSPATLPGYRSGCTPRKQGSTLSSGPASRGGDHRGHARCWRERRFRTELPVGPFFCVLDGTTRGRAWSQTGARVELRRLAAQAGVRRLRNGASDRVRGVAYGPADGKEVQGGQAGVGRCGLECCAPAWISRGLG